jgi:Uma2 family endonuclease
MITTPEDLAIRCAADFERLPAEGHWEVVDGTAVLLPGNELDHQDVVDELSFRLGEGLRQRGRGRRNTATNVDIPGNEFRTRVPDIVVYERRPAGKRFQTGEPPEIAIEVLATPRGNVEHSEKIDDYARAGIAEYWIVNPFERNVEIYRLEEGEYKHSEVASDAIDSFAMPGLRIDLRGCFKPGSERR